MRIMAEKIDFNTIDIDKLSQIIKRFIEIALPLLPSAIQKHVEISRLTNIIQFPLILIEEEKGLELNVFTNDNQITTSFKKFDVYRFSDGFIFNLLKTIKNNESFNNELSELSELGFWIPEVEYIYDFKISLWEGF